MAFALAAGAAGGGFFSGVLGIGLSIGMSLLSGLLAPKPKPSQQGKLSDLTIQSADYGSDIVHAWGTIVVPARFIDSGPKLKETKHEITAGKGFMTASPSGFYYTYAFDGAFILTANEIKAVLRLWPDTKLIRDVRGADLATRVASGSKVKGGGSLRFFYGTEDQLPDPLLEKIHGVGQVPAYRGQSGFVADNFQLANYGNHVPNFSAEVMTAGEEGFEPIGTYAINEIYPYPAGRQASWSYVDGNGEILVMTGIAGANYQSIFASGALTGQFVFQVWQLLSNGSIVPAERVAPLTSNSSTGVSTGGISYIGHSDEPMFVTSNAGSFIVFSVENNTATVFLRPPAIDFPIDDFGVFLPSRWHKKGESFWVIANTGGLILENAHILEYNLAGIFLRGSEALSAASGKLRPDDFMVGDDYLWALHSGFGVGSDLLYKIDLANLEVVETIDLGINNLRNLFVENDNHIRFIGRGVGMKFYDYIDGELILLGEAGGVDGNTFGSGALYVRNGIWYTGANRFGHYNLDITAWGPGADPECVPLSRVVGDRCKMSALRPSQFDVSELTDCLDGYAQSRRADGKTVLAPLQGAYFFDGAEYDGKINWRKRGRAPSATILQDDMAAHEPSSEEPNPIIVTEENERELPARMEITYLQRDKDYEQGNQYDERLITDSRRSITHDYPISLGNDKARQIVQVLMRSEWTGRNRVEIALSRKHARLAPTDTINVEL